MNSELRVCDAWGILRRAELFGWKDPGYTETIEETVKRAQEYLDQLGSSSPLNGEGL